MRTLDRYILTEMLWPFLGGLLVFVVLITGHMLFLAIEVMVDHRVPFGSVLRYVWYQAPWAAGMAMPVASLLATALTMNRLANDHELPAMRAGGVSLFRLMWPAILVGLVAMLASLWLNGDLAPRARLAADGMMRAIVLQQKTLAFRPGQFVDTGRGVWLYAGEVDHARETVANLWAFSVQGDSPVVAYWTSMARFHDVMLWAASPEAYVLTPAGHLATLQGAELTVDLTTVQGSGNVPTGYLQTETSGSLWARAQSGKPGGEAAWLELQSRLAMAGACLVFALLAGPVVLRFGRGQSLLGVLITIIVVFVYYVVMLWLRMLANGGSLPPVVAAHLQNAILAVGALVAIWRQR